MIDFIKFNMAIQTLKNQADALHKADEFVQIIDIMEDIDMTMKAMWNYVEEGQKEQNGH